MSVSVFLKYHSLYIMTFGDSKLCDVNSGHTSSDARPLQQGELRRPESMVNNRPDSSVISPQHVRVMLPVSEKEKQIPVIQQQYMQNIHQKQQQIPVIHQTSFSGEFLLNLRFIWLIF